MRVPAIDPNRDKLIRHFEKKLDYFQGIPAHRRANEAADEGEATCRSMLAELRGSQEPGSGGRSRCADSGRMARRDREGEQR